MAPQTHDPSLVSDDVQLVQPYDGSGWGLNSNIAESIQVFDSLVGTTQDSEMFIVPPDRVFRLLAVSFFLIAGADPSQIYLICSIPLVANRNVAVTEMVTTLTSAARAMPSSHTPILLPGTRVRNLHAFGDGLTQTRAEIYIVDAPIGTVFYV